MSSPIDDYFTDRPSSLSHLPPSPLYNTSRVDRFPCTSLEEDFVRIHPWETEEVEADSFCKSFLNGLYPSSIIRWFNSLPRYGRILIIISIFILLLLLSMGIVALLLYLISPNNNDDSEWQTMSPPPADPYNTGTIKAMTQLVIPLNCSMSATLSPAPGKLGVYYAYDNIQTMTIITRTIDDLKLRSITIIGMEYPSCKDYYPLKFFDNDNDGDKIDAKTIPWCCSSDTVAYCSAYYTDYSSEATLVYKSFDIDTLYFTFLNQIGNKCTLTYHSIDKDMNHRILNTTPCAGSLVPVQSATGTILNGSVIQSAVLNDRTLLLTDGINGFKTIYTFNTMSYSLNSLLLSRKSSGDIVTGVVSSWGASVAHLFNQNLSLIQFLPYLPYNSVISGSFFDDSNSLLIWQCIDNDQEIYLSYYSFLWDIS